MGKWRNISGDDRIIGFGIPMPQTIKADDVAVVDDGADESYDNQPTIWEQVSDAPTSTPSTKKAAPSAPSTDNPSTDASASE